MHDKEKSGVHKHVINEIDVDILFASAGLSPEGTLCRKGRCESEARLSASAIN